MTLGERHRVAELVGGFISCRCGWEHQGADFGRAYLAHCQHLIRMAQGHPAGPEREIARGGVGEPRRVVA